ncbi:DUF2971 domain-containing protein [Vibrio salinus]|uniref:DUF2971 domain-containing protein n=1 Tax=Vibrio salinus TaxID=2899784 RepID=UPI001E2F4180|nr:DUF2971 domain-containing protein [Vibrio salinus]MCE0494656.1 DUF2971 domain-containing protein [Vibrio salinus]
MSKIYKYFNNDVLDLVFDRDGFCGVKCSLPKDYNDPYELFLGMDLNTPPELLAFYYDVISEIPQSPTTCFSYSPIVSPMWAHYANNHSGFVLEFDLEGMQEYFEGNPIWDVTYRKEPLEQLKNILARAVETLKPRHSYDLQEAVFVESYFSKYVDWSYEQECRLVDLKNKTENIAGNDILYIPYEFITSIIVGPKFPDDKVETSKKISKDAGLDWYELKIGKSYPKPYMIDFDKKSFIFNNSNIVSSEHCCTNCSEPLEVDRQLCAWCSITEAHKNDAAMKNPFRMLNQIGKLDEYMDAMGKVGR